MANSVVCDQPAKHRQSPSPTERLSLTDYTDDNATESDTDSESLPSVQDVLSGRSEGGNLHHKIVESSTQQEKQRYKRHGSVEVPESPNLYGYLNGSSAWGKAIATTEPHDETAPTTNAGQQDEVHGSSDPSGSNHSFERRTSVKHRRNDPQVNKCSVIVHSASFLHVYEQRERGQGPEYRCLIGAWIGSRDGIPHALIQEYEVRARRRSLRKRKHEADGDERVVQKIRLWKENSE